MTEQPENAIQSNVSTAPRSGAIPSLDGVRAIAVSLVFFAHSGLENVIPGGLGVTIFFVLSGYLITTLMRGEFRQTGSISYPAFYLRRLLRLMPPLLIVTAAAGVLSSISVIDGSFSREGLLSALFYFGNYYVITHDFQGLPAGLGVIWSLAVEEHYYLVYPPLALLLLRVGNSKFAVAILSILCAVILAWRCWLASQGTSPAYIAMATDTRVDAILIGCVMGLSCNPWPRLDQVANRRWHWIVATGCLFLLFTSLLYRSDFFRMTFRYTLQSLAIAPLIYLAIAKSGHAAFRWLNSKPMVYLGSISYTVYLTHQLVLYFVLHHWPQIGWAATTATTALLTLVIAEPMRRWIEQPCATLRSRLHRSSVMRRSKRRDASMEAL